MTSFRFSVGRRAGGKAYELLQTGKGYGLAGG